MLSEICIESKIFDGARIELNQALRETITEMLYNHKSEGNVTMKLKIEIDGVTMAGNYAPEFSFKISTNIPSRNSIGGKLRGDYTLCFDGDAVKLNTLSEQTSMLDEGSAKE